MSVVTFIEHSGTVHTVEGNPNRTLMQLAIDNGISGILGECGGACSCATCHGFVDERWLDRVPSMSATESFMLDVVPDRRSNSRLCCQIRMCEELDGVVVRLPEEQF